MNRVVIINRAIMNKVSVVIINVIMNKVTRDVRNELLIVL